LRLKPRFISDGLHQRMVITVTQKVQLLVLVGCLAIGCYFYILHKDLERHVGELHDRVQYLLKVNAPQNQAPVTSTSTMPVSNVQDVNSVIEVSPIVNEVKTVNEVKAVKTVNVAVDGDDAGDDADADADSVTSNDIKDLLTNIYNDDGDVDIENDINGDVDGVKTVEDVKTVQKEVQDQVEVKDSESDETPVTVAVAVTVTETVVESGQKAIDIGQMSDEEIMKIKYDDMRSYLRKHGVNIKGNKQEMLAKIREINAPFTSPNEVKK
jgi:phage antirepressor YoqD-like protein